MAPNALDNGLAALTFARQATLGFLEDFPKDKLCHQLTPGGNHASWIVGHLANTDNEFLVNLGGKNSKCPETWGKLFGMGSKPVGDAGAYPSFDDLRQAVHERREELTAWFNSMTDDQLAAPLPQDYEMFAPNFCGLASSLAWHEGLHAGQLTMIRRDIGLKPKFG